MLPFTRYSLNVKIVDCFIFNDEIEILKFRLDYLASAVDYFVIAESKTTFSGAEKLLYASNFVEELPIDSYLRQKIKIIEYEFPLDLIRDSQIDRWPLERFARVSLRKEISNLNPKDVVILSDVDEIPTIAQIKKGSQSKELLSLLTPLYYRRANWASISGQNWQTVKIGPAHFFEDLNSIRYMKLRCLKRNKGAHLSYLAKSHEDISRKANQSAHKEFDIDSNSTQFVISLADQYRIEHLGRFYRKGFGLLKVYARKDLGEVQKNFLERYPDFFEFSTSRHSKINRIKASYFLWTVWSGRDFRDNFKSSDIQIVTILFHHYAHRALEIKSKIVHHISKFIQRLKEQIVGIWP